MIPDDVKSLLDERNERFVALFARSQSALFGYILSLLPNWADAEDVLQQTSVVLWQKFDQFDSEGDSDGFARWACQIAKYKVLNRLKKLGRDRHVFSFSEELLALLADEGTDDLAALDAERRALAGCLGRLQARHRWLIQSCYAGVCSIKTIAQTTGCTPNSLYKQLDRLRRQLLKCVQRALVEGGNP